MVCTYKLRAAWHLWRRLTSERDRYEKIKEKVQKVSGRQDLGFADYLVSSGLAGGMTSLFTNPIWVVKTRMLSTNSQYTNAYTGMFQGLRLIKKEEGIRGFYRGFVPSLLGVGHGAVQIMFYEEMKKWYSHRNLGVTQLKHDEANNESSNLVCFMLNHVRIHVC